MTCICEKPILIKSTSLEIKNNKFIINIPTPKTIKNNKNFKLILCQSLPVCETILNVSICWEDGTEVDLMSRTGNYVKSDQLKNRTCYPILLGTEPLHYSMLAFIPRSKCLYCLYNLETIDVIPTQGIPKPKTTPTEPIL